MNSAISNYSDLEALFYRQRQYHINHIKQSSATARIHKLKSLRQSLLNHKAQFHQAMQEDFAKSAAEVDLSEFFTTMHELNFAIKHLKHWLNTKKAKTPLSMIGSHSYIRYEPRGVVLIISPWNYPLQLVLCPLISAIAAGNCAMLKYSPLTPATNALIKSMLSEIFSQQEIAPIDGDENRVQQLLALPFDHIFFTGSTRVGKIIMETAAKTLTSVTLELGGKSPVIIDDTVDLKDAAEKIIWGKFINAGQSCIAPDYIWIDEKCKNAFIEQVINVINRFSKGLLDTRSPDYCRIINDTHFNRLKKLYDDAVAQGAKTICGGKFNAQDRYIPLTVLTDVTDQMAIMQEEIFGPLLPMLTYQSLENDLLVKLSHYAKPLALYIFSRDVARQNKIINHSSAGGTVINNTLIQFTNPNIPFGGIGTCGIGNYHGFYGFKTFSHERAIVEQGKFNGFRYFYPPYTDSVKKWINHLLRFLT